MVAMASSRSGVTYSVSNVSPYRPVDTTNSSQSSMACTVIAPTRLLVLSTTAHSITAYMPVWQILSPACANVRRLLGSKSSSVTCAQPNTSDETATAHRMPFFLPPKRARRPPNSIPRNIPSSEAPMARHSTSELSSLSAQPCCTASPALT